MSEPMGMSGGGHLGEGISALLDGELSPTAVAQAEAHLQACGRCRAEFDATASVRAAVRGLPAVDPPAGFIDDILRAAMAGADPGATPEGAVAPVTPIAAALRRRRPPVWVAGVAAAAALVALALVPRHQQQIRPPVASFVDAHATAVPGAEPVTELAPVAIPVSFQAP